MSSFLIYKPLLFFVEGGFQNNPDDAGNYNSLGELIGTNFGISARFYEQVLKRPTTVNDILSLTKEKATDIYKSQFWDRMQASSINSQKLANTYVDHGINAGPSRSIKMIQYVLVNSFNKNIAIDGAIGPQTLTSINSIYSHDLTNKFNELRGEYYNYLGGRLNDVSLSSQEFFNNELEISPASNHITWVDGWLNRLEKFAYDNKSLGAGLIVLFAGVSTLLLLSRF